MTGGSLSLSGTRGTGQDVININPQITFFKKMYKRHTNFGIEAIRQNDVSTTQNFGGTTELNISKVGSLITDMHFEFTLPPAAKSGVPAIQNNPNHIFTTINNGVVSNYVQYAHWVNAVGFAIINEVSLKFGSNIIDKHTGLWYDIWNELTDPNRKEWPLVGKFEDNKEGVRDINTTRYYVPLKFYFNRNPGLAIPIFLLNENELKINLSFSSLDSLLNYQASATATTSVDNTKKIENFKFYANYVFLEQEEESRIQNSLPSEYLVETLDIKDNISADRATNLVFDNPVKEFIWVFRHSSRIVVGDPSNVNLIPKDNGDGQIFPNDIFNYSKMNLNTHLDYGTRDPFSQLTIQINNNDRFENTDATFFRTMQPYKYHSNIPGGINNNPKKQFIYVYSFALNPEEYQPTGSYNFSIGDDLVSFSFTGPDADSNNDSSINDYDLTIFAVRYEYIVFNYGRVTKSRVPIQTGFQEAQAETSAEVKKDSKGQPIKGTGTKGGAVAQEINRRYAREVTYKGDSTLSKKKWSGLQGNFFQNQKNSDLGRDSKYKKKDIV